MKNTKNILDLSKVKKNKKSFFGLKSEKSRKNSNSKPNLSFGVKVVSVRSKKRTSARHQKLNSSIKSRLLTKKKIKGVRSRAYDTADSSSEIDAIWKDSKNINKSTFDQRPSNRKKTLPIIILLLFLLAASSMAGWYFFASKELNGQGLSLEVKGNEKIISGEQVELLIKYHNKENVKLKNLELRINYPEGFHYISSDPYANTLSSNVWQLDDLKAGASGEVKLIGQIIGELDEEIVLEPILSYEPSNFSSSFESKVIKVFKVEDLLMDFRVEAPEEIGNDNRVTYNIFYQNISNLPLDNFRIRMDYPDNFTIIETGGDAKLLTNNIWEIDEMMKDEENEIIVTGFFDLENTSSSTAKVILEIKSSLPEIPLIGESNPNWYSYLIIEKDITLSELAASLKISVNGDNKDSAIDWGSESEYVINYQNTSDSDLENVSIVAMLNSEYLDWDSLDDNFNGLVDEGVGTITWDKRIIPSLSKLDIGQEGRISFKIKSVDFEEEFLETENYAISSKALLDSDTFEIIESDDSTEETESKVIDSNIIVNKINSVVNFSTRARYYDESDQAVGSGPLPPFVGETTSYQIVWDLKSLTSNLKNVIIKTTLPPGVEWGQGIVVDGQDLIFNDTTRQVVWRVSDLVKDTDNIAKFSVLITPDESQIGKIVTLNNTIILTAKDVSSNGKINLSNSYLTTELEGDTKAAGNEIVIDLDL
jgi:hypothetical protein